jgi:hypothetical protein
VFSVFLSLQGARSSKDIIEADGVLSFDKENQMYEISNKEKLSEMSLPGNYVSLNTQNCVVSTEGKYNISKDLGQVKLNCIGNAVHSTINDSATFNLMMIFDFFFDNGLTKKMAKDFELYLGNLTPTPFEGDLFNHGLIELLGKERGDRALSELNLYGNFKKFPDELEKPLVLNNVTMEFNSKTKSYISRGDIGVGNIGKTEIFRYVPNSVIEIKKSRAKDKDVFNIYLEPDGLTWYFFTYTNGVLLVESSNEAFNKDLKEMKSKAKKMDVEKGPSFKFDYARGRKDKFLSELKRKGAYGNEEKKVEEE